MNTANGLKQYMIFILTKCRYSIRVVFPASLCRRILRGWCGRGCYLGFSFLSFVVDIMGYNLLAASLDDDEIDPRSIGGEIDRGDG